ncbi:MAG: hypothetical protein V3T86_02080 [Planctomycetota bacterium]
MARGLMLVLLLAGQAWADGYCDLKRFKIDAAGEQRKAGLYIPKDLGRNEWLPLLVTVPQGDAKAIREMGQWELAASEGRFAVLSVDIVTGLLKRGWLPSEQVSMQNDMEAVENAIKRAKEVAPIEDSAIFITGFSGGTYLALWMGLRRPDLFLGICGRAPLSFKETVPPSKFDKYADFKPNTGQHIFLYTGKADVTRAPKETRALIKQLKEKKYTNIRYDEKIEKMKHESKPELCVEWMNGILKQSAKARKARRKIGAEITKLKAKWAKGRRSYAPLKKLVEKEKKAGIQASAHALFAEVMKEANELVAKAKGLEDGGDLVKAAESYKIVEKKYAPLPVSKACRAARTRIVKSDAYKADQLYVSAMRAREAGNEEKAIELLTKIADGYPATPAGKKAKDEVGEE